MNEQTPADLRGTGGDYQRPTDGRGEMMTWLTQKDSASTLTFLLQQSVKVGQFTFDASKDARRVYWYYGDTIISQDDLTSVRRCVLDHIEQVMGTEEFNKWNVEDMDSDNDSTWFWLAQKKPTADYIRGLRLSVAELRKLDLSHLSEEDWTKVTRGCIATNIVTPKLVEVQSVSLDDDPAVLGALRKIELLGTNHINNVLTQKFGLAVTQARAGYKGFVQGYLTDGGADGQSFIVQHEADGMTAEEMNSRGELCTLRYLEAQHKDHFDVHVQSVHQFSTHPSETPTLVAEWLVRSKAQVLNIAGNSEKTSPGIEKWAARFLSQMFSAYQMMLLDKPR